MKLTWEESSRLEEMINSSICKHLEMKMDEMVGENRKEYLEAFDAYVEQDKALLKKVFSQVELEDASI